MTDLPPLTLFSDNKGKKRTSVSRSRSRSRSNEKHLSSTSQAQAQVIWLIVCLFVTVMWCDVIDNTLIIDRISFSIWFLKQEVGQKEAPPNKLTIISPICIYHLFIYLFIYLSSSTHLSICYLSSIIYLSRISTYQSISVNSFFPSYIFFLSFFVIHSLLFF